MKKSEVARRALAVGAVVTAVLGAVVAPASAWHRPPVVKPSGLDFTFHSKRVFENGPLVTERLLSPDWEVYPADKPLLCVYERLHPAMPASFRDGYWVHNLPDTGSGATPYTTEHFGRAGDTPFCGQTTPADKSMWEQDRYVVWRQGVFYIQVGLDVRAVPFGKPTDTPLLGDWDGDSVDEIAVKRGNQYFFATDNVPGGGGVRTSTFGEPSDRAVIAASYYNQGVDTLVLRRGNKYLFTADAPGTPTMKVRDEVAFGKATDTPLDVEMWIDAVPEARQVAVARLGPDS
ncbi:hypothetical protein [uncultured Pseudokineococcus sp.]|uniref:hypothetical protein n=1 Tax=uncultured Pseudokineococcus sp. TaxID=1642928 RepID=UPI0026390BE0|nr:hypothetical protein [uncultured Pseudokineococcus sp.]